MPYCVVLCSCFNWRPMQCECCYVVLVLMLWLTSAAVRALLCSLQFFIESLNEPFVYGTVTSAALFHFSHEFVWRVEHLLRSNRLSWSDISCCLSEKNLPQPLHDAAILCKHQKAVSVFKFSDLLMRSGTERKQFRNRKTKIIAVGLILRRSDHFNRYPSLKLYLSSREKICSFVSMSLTSQELISSHIDRWAFCARPWQLVTQWRSRSCHVARAFLWLMRAIKGTRSSIRRHKPSDCSSLIFVAFDSKVRTTQGYY